jgi:hypothetical protein
MQMLGQLVSEGELHHRHPCRGTGIEAPPLRSPSPTGDYVDCRGLLQPTLPSACLQRRHMLKV